MPSGIHRGPTRRLSPLQKAGWRWLAAAFLVSAGSLPAAEFVVNPTGHDANPGTADRPFASLGRAQQAVREVAGQQPVTVTVQGGTYYLESPLVFTPEDGGSAPIVYRVAPGVEAVLSGGRKLTLQWAPHTNGIWRAVVGETPVRFDQLFVNGAAQPMARYPNYDATVRPYGGFAADAFSRERARRWTNPHGGYIHAMHRAHWGGYHYRITGKDTAGEVVYEGGWQNNRQMGMHAEHRYVEGIFEELDAPGEWFHEAGSGTLYYWPPTGIDLASASIEVVQLRHLVEIQGRPAFRTAVDRLADGSPAVSRPGPRSPVRHLTLEGFTFRHAARTFMDTREPLLRSDWTIYRGGAVVVDGAEDCAIVDCTFDQVGGNAIFVNHYNRRIAIRGCLIRENGGNGICFVGDPTAVRNPLFEYNQRQDYTNVDRTPGPQTDNYPSDCIVEDNLITRIGRVEKQAAAVQISMARRITVRNCSIYEVPRAGINVSEGTWGGHVIEGCDIFDTVLETGDHGSFNSWGRDRYWGLTGIELGTVTLGEHRDLPLLDAVETTVLRNNRWRCDHGWDIDLDDGSSNYEIRNNLCLNGGIKLREGFYRVCENNVMVNNSFHPHVWYKNSQDVFRRNIVFTPYRPIQVTSPWGKECDFNLLHQPGKDPAPATELQSQSGLDAHSLVADAMFVDPGSGDYRVREGSPALKLGFDNFAMDQFGVRKPSLKAIARKPVLPTPVRPDATAGLDSPDRRWAGATLRDLGGEDYSALGVPRDARGAWVIGLTDDTVAWRVGLRPNDLVQQLNGQRVFSASAFIEAIRALPAGQRVILEVVRAQRPITVEFELGERQ